MAELAGYRVRKIAPNGTVSTLAGTGATGATNGHAGSARFGRPAGVAVDAQGTVYVADLQGQTIRLIAPNSTVSTLAGTGTRGAANGSLQVAQFDQPSGIALDALGNLLVTGYGNRVRKISAR